MPQEMRTARATGTMPAELMQALMGKTGQDAGPKPPAEVPVSPRTVPLVAAMLVVSDVNRLRFARAAVNNFVRQSYANKHLVIVNGCDPAAYPAEEKRPDSDEVVALTAEQRAERTRVTNREHPWITEVACPNGLTVGAMRNLALAALPKPTRWVALWDDDNFAHQHRIAYQMAHRLDDEDTAVMLRKEIRVDVVNAVAVPFESPAGIHSSLLFPVDLDRPLPQFPDKTGYEDAEFWIRHWGGKQVVVPNTGDAPQSVMQVAFWHGKNVTTRQQFLGEHADPKWFRRAAVTADELYYLNAEIGPSYGAKFAATKADSQQENRTAATPV